MLSFRPPAIGQVVQLECDPSRKKARFRRSDPAINKSADAQGTQAAYEEELHAPPATFTPPVGGVTSARFERLQALVDQGLMTGCRSRSARSNGHVVQDAAWEPIPTNTAASGVRSLPCPGLARAWHAAGHGGLDGVGCGSIGFALRWARSSAFLDTPALPCVALGRALGCSVTLKVETLNPVRSRRARHRDGCGRGTQKGASRWSARAPAIWPGTGLQRRASRPGGHRRGGENREPAEAPPDRRVRRGCPARGRGHRRRPAAAREIAQAGRAYLVEDSFDLATCEAPPRSASSSSTTIRGSTSCSWPSAPEPWPAAWATPCARSPSTWR